MNTTTKALVGIAAGIGIGLAAASFAAPGWGPGYGGWGNGYGNCPWRNQAPADVTQQGAAPAWGPGSCGMGRGMGPGMGRGMGHGMRGGRGTAGADPEARVEQRLDGLKSGLGITDEQEPAWQAFADQLRTQAKTMTANRAAMQALHRSGTTTALQRMEQREAFMAGRQEAMAQTHGAFRTLYEQLTPEQRSVADQIAMGPGMMGHGRGMGPGRGMGSGMGPRW